MATRLPEEISPCIAEAQDGVLFSGLNAGTKMVVCA
jgi:hypothetical protein